MTAQSEIGQSDGSCSETDSSSGSDTESSDDSDSISMDGMATPTISTNAMPLVTESETCKMCITNSPRSKVYFQPPSLSLNVTYY